MSDPLEMIRKTYPGARSTEEFFIRIIGVIQESYGFAPHHLMHADSICADDLNAIEYPKVAREMLGPFSLGGLDGFPFAGVTGMRAFAEHVPEKGAAFIFHAPHVGVTRDGTVGEIMRPGQRSPSSCCGAASLALKQLLDGKLEKGAIDELDYQQNTLEQILLSSEKRIVESENPTVCATEVFYEAIEKRIDLLLERTQFRCDHVFLLGGILINGDLDVGSFCEVRRFAHLDLTTSHRTDWLDKDHRHQ